MFLVFGYKDNDKKQQQNNCFSPLFLYLKGKNFLERGYLHTYMTHNSFEVAKAAVEGALKL